MPLPQRPLGKDIFWWLATTRLPKTTVDSAGARRARGDQAHPYGRRSRARILILTTFDLDEYVYEALKAGASGFVLKDDPEQLIEAIRTVAAGDALLSPAVTKHVIKQFMRLPRPAPPKEFDDLSEREREVFRLIAGGLSNGEIGQELYISDTTVKTHITHIFKKLHLRDRVQAVVLAYQTGMFDADTQPPILRD